jgi:hypothetical protein
MFHSIEAGTAYQPESSGLQIGMTIFFTLYYLLMMVLYCLPQIGVAFQYFNLVELKESKGLLNSIESFGQNQPPPAQQQDEHY